MRAISGLIRKSRRSPSFSSALLLFLLLMFIYPAHAPSKKRNYKQIQERSQRIKQEKKEVQQKVRKLRQQQRSLAEEIKDIEKHLEKASARHRQLRRELVEARMQTRYYAELLQETEKNLEQSKALFERRLVEIYKYGKIQPIAVIASASTMWDFLSQTYYLGKMMENDAQMISETERQARLLAEQKQKKEQHERKIERLTQEMREVEQNLSITEKKKRQFYYNIDHSRKYYEKMLAELEAESRRIDSWLKSFRYRGKIYWTGRWLRPVPGRISSGFGRRLHPILGIYRMHTGLDFSAAYGTPIKAAATGEVIWASWRGGYGKTVILAHGKDITTLYAHMSRILVSVGQIVQAGQIIGLVGSTGLSTGPHLHFEERHNGTPVNPL